MSQMKEQEKITTKGLNKIEISKMPSKEIKVMIIKRLAGLEKRVKDLSETINNQNIKKMKNQYLKYTRRNQKQIRGCKRTYQSSGRQGDGKQPS